MKQAYLECGKIINTHGFRGGLKLESWCDTPQVLAGLKTVYFEKNGTFMPRRILHASVFRQFVLMELEGIADEESANALRGKIVFAAREDLPLPAGGFFLADVIGLPVKDADTGELLGMLTDIDPRPSGDLLTVKTESGIHYVPCVPQFVTRVDADDAVYIRPIPGLLDGGAEQV